MERESFGDEAFDDLGDSLLTQLVTCCDGVERVLHPILFGVDSVAVLLEPL